jgi:hypothetical protein
MPLSSLNMNMNEYQHFLRSVETIMSEKRVKGKEREEKITGNQNRPLQRMRTLSASKNVVV